MIIEQTQLRKILEGALLAAGHPLSLARLQTLFEPADKAADDDTLHPEVPGKDIIQAALEGIQADCEDRGFQLKEVASGWRFQVCETTAPWVNRLWDEKPQRYSRALLETLALIAYRQPITRGDIEEIRGVAVSSHIIKTLVEREWVKVVGHRDVPGRPSLYATTRQFLDYFNVKNLEDLPTLGEIRDLDELNKELDLGIEAQIAKSAGSVASVETDEASEAEDASETEETSEVSEMSEVGESADADLEENVETRVEGDDEQPVESNAHDEPEETQGQEHQDLEALDHEQEENPDPDFDDSFESAAVAVTEEKHDA
jgi:segregation and condensation protein B